MVEYIKIEYAGAEIEIPKFLLRYWPHNLPLAKWPSFCGAGQGLGDTIVPDELCGVRIAAACFIHDIDWAISDSTDTWFLKSNARFFFNLRSLLIANSRKSRWRIEWQSLMYLLGVTVFGHKCFERGGEPGVLVSNPEDNPVVQDRILRLNSAIRQL